MTNQQLTTTDNKPRVSLVAAMASKYHMEPAAFQQTIKATVMPSNATNEQMAAFLLVANEYDLNPITKEIYAFPSRGGGVTPVVGVDGWINLAQRRSEFDGIEHEWEHDEKGAPISCTCRIWRKDRTRPVVVTEFMDECRRPTDPWKSHPRRMLRHKATIQAIRYAFGFAGIKDEDDAEVINARPVIAERNITPAADLNARLSHSIEQASAPDDPPPATAAPAPPIDDAEAEQDQAPEWPKVNEDGELIDARGIPFIEAVHSSAKRCNADGSWRRARGVNEADFISAERRAMDLLNPAASLEAVLIAIGSASDQAALKAAAAEAAKLTKPADQEAARAAYKHRVAELKAAMEQASAAPAAEAEPAEADQSSEIEASLIRAAQTAADDDERAEILDAARDLSPEARDRITAALNPA